MTAADRGLGVEGVVVAISRKSHQNSIFLRFLGENLKFPIFLFKISKIKFFVTETSLKRHCEVK